MSTLLDSGVGQCLLREWHRITSRRIYLAASVVLPLFLIFFMATIFGTGQMQRLPIGIVDADNSAASREVVRNLAATPTLDVYHHYADDAAARRALQRKDIYGYLSIPYGFAADRARGHGVTLSYYYHYALLAVGGEVMSAFEQALLPVRLAPIVTDAVMLGDDATNIKTFLLPMTSDDHPLYNPSLNYATYLTVPIFCIMFQILVLLTSLYAIGSEGKEGTGHHWLATSQGHIVSAVVGKLLPYTMCFLVELLFAGVVYFRFMNIPVEGSAWLLGLAALLFVLATQSVALILYTLMPALSFTISVVSMVGSLGATLSGLTFPLSAMSPVVQYIAQLFPVRHFTVAMQHIVYFPSMGTSSVVSLVVLALFPLLSLLLFPRLRHIIIVHQYDTLE